MASAESKSSRNERLLILLLCSAALRVFRTAPCSPKCRPKCYGRHRFFGIFQPIGSRPFRSRPRTRHLPKRFEGLGDENRLDALHERSDRATADVDENH
jgi:hypothetical protein